MVLRRLTSVALLPWLDCLSLAAWGGLLLLYWLRGDLNLLIHPAYQALTVFTAIAFLGMAIARGWQLKSQRPFPQASHSALLPRRLSIGLLLLVAVAGFIIPPRVFANDLARDRDLADLTGYSRSRPQAFRSSQRPEERTITDWVRTLNVYPEPSAYVGQRVNVTGFAMHPPELPSNYLLVARFTLTCCAADAYPLGLPVRLPAGDRQSYPVDQWLSVQGVMQAETVAGKKQVVIAARQVQPISPPSNPYDS
ncbi:TIGR03943 family putative permease subunit [Synechococcus elongatus]|uniref:DUF1980 domain-containing protein n=2 Tax=Synechococcus elongatus TaxID=32046 RepID=Q31R52_SYNE7|nr:TIGR03943 family protein [Synechococcus elongatus]ABB56467.1 conserved hypothetical protein [Synechococcus elongatus PCC 7942 = FACHB-805]AJD56488.1 membrane protein [Synechococcus elongatus UTEX 2973]MBD2588951.1 TIGR03943 family protein [Synechococcus elongatus FACHB-242]MBD2690017.1 TIGR03943 family protein [Synechococcus elongatus FACHB-1061]MBD2706988.1 TIGR03943 family protein [Synechococcus elongatus PCC 7942 = FACHB-805]